MILDDSQWFMNQSEIVLEWFLVILGDSWNTLKSFLEWFLVIHELVWNCFGVIFGDLQTTLKSFWGQFLMIHFVKLCYDVCLHFQWNRMNFQMAHVASILNRFSQTMYHFKTENILFQISINHEDSHKDLHWFTLIHTIHTCKSLWFIDGWKEEILSFIHSF